MTVVVDSAPEVDATPPVVIPDNNGLYCSDCGSELTYGGRGRKPKRCSKNNGGNPDCYSARTKSDSSEKAVSSGRKTNNALARQAADVLAQLNDFIGTGCFVLGMRRTAKQIQLANNDFAEKAEEALALDPALCRMILRGGRASGKLALGIAYASFFGSVFPVAWEDYQDRYGEEKENAA